MNGGENAAGQTDLMPEPAAGLESIKNPNGTCSIGIFYDRQTPLFLIAPDALSVIAYGHDVGSSFGPQHTRIAR